MTPLISAIGAARDGATQNYATRVALTDPAVHFQLYELSGATSVIDRIGGKPGFLINLGDIEFRLPALVEGGAASTAFGGDEDLPGYITVQDFLVGIADIGVAAVVQPDVSKAKHVVITSAQDATGDDVGGNLSLELVDDGAGGLRVRGWSVDSGGTPRVIEGSVGDVAPGQAVHLAYVRRSNGSPSQIIYLDGEIAAQDPVDRGTWPNMPSSNWYVGVWPAGQGAPLDGVIAEVVGWNTVPNQTHIQSLALAQGFSQVADFGADPIVVDTTENVTIKGRFGIHTKGIIIPEVTSQGTLVIASPDGETILRQAASIAGSDSLGYRVTDDRGQTNTAAIHYEVTDPAAAAGEPWQGLGVGIYVVSYCQVTGSEPERTRRFT